MTATPGTRLGPYEIASFIGAGGMGEVYRARDTRLARDVAIKLLPASVSSDRDRLQRFEQEARAAAALNHPGILAVFDIGEANGAPFIVSELLEGQSLRERLDAGRLPLRKAVAYAVQVAQALGAAHVRGIVHRDLKPENLFIVDEERVKILDFGLAKLTEREVPVSSATAMPTSPPATEPGVVLGTAGYMAPEQVRGVAADHRADIFAFGAVLYEMLTGRRAFHGVTPMDTMTAILKEEPPEPPVTDAPVPPALLRIAHRCLEKPPAARFQTASDLAFALESTSASGSGVDRAPAADMPPVRSGRGRQVREAVAWGLAAVGVVAAVFFAARGPSARAVSDSRPVQFTVPPSPGRSFNPNNPVVGVPSPDGHLMALMLRGEGGAPEIWIRSMDSAESRQIARSESPLPGGGLFWSPDSRYLGFFTATAMKKVDASQPDAPSETIWARTGQAAIELPGFDNFSGPTAAWNADGTIIFSGTVATPIARVSASGGQASAVTTIDAAHGESGHRAIQFLPDGRHFLYIALPRKTIYAGSLDGEPPVTLLTPDSKAMYAAGHLLFVRQGTLLAQPFDVEKLQLSGEPVAIAKGIDFNPYGSAAFHASNGVLAYRTNVVTTAQFGWYDRAGRAIGPPIGEQAMWREFALSPDNRFVAAERADAGLGAVDLWLIDLIRGVSSRLTTDPGSETDPVWSPDGRFLLHTREAAAASADVYRKDVVTGEDSPVLTGSGAKWPEDWSRDGSRVILLTAPAGSTTTTVLKTFAPANPQDVSVWLDDTFMKDEPHFSPDGHWVAYAATDSGQFDVYLQPFPGPGRKVRVSSSGGSQPLWRADGKELFYLTLDGTLMAVPMSGAAAMEPGIATTLFRTPVPVVNAVTNQYAVSADGQRFLLAVPSGNGGQMPITVTLNWASRLVGPTLRTK
jgi:Tol biopolymer transport system component